MTARPVERSPQGLYQLSRVPAPPRSHLVVLSSSPSPPQKSESRWLSRVAASGHERASDFSVVLVVGLLLLPSLHKRQRLLCVCVAAVGTVEHTHTQAHVLVGYRPPPPPISLGPGRRRHNPRERGERVGGGGGVAGGGVAAGASSGETQPQQPANSNTVFEDPFMCAGFTPLLAMANTAVHVPVPLLSLWPTTLQYPRTTHHGYGQHRTTAKLISMANNITVPAPLPWPTLNTALPMANTGVPMANTAVPMASTAVPMTSTHRLRSPIPMRRVGPVLGEKPHDWERVAIGRRDDIHE